MMMIDLKSVSEKSEGKVTSYINYHQLKLLMSWDRADIAAEMLKKCLEDEVNLYFIDYTSLTLIFDNTLFRLLSVQTNACWTFKKNIIV